MKNEDVIARMFAEHDQRKALLRDTIRIPSPDAMAEWLCSLEAVSAWRTMADELIEIMETSPAREDKETSSDE